MSYLNDGTVFVHNRDKDGKSLLIFTYRKHIKGQKDFEDMKKIVVYWMERVERYFLLYHIIFILSYYMNLLIFY